jgi:tetratricopeptide (TPR) repeat protein
MPPRNVHQGRSGLVRVSLLWLSVWGFTPLSAQELTLQRNYPGLGPFACPAPDAILEPAPDDRVQAGQLASDAVQAVILGELLRAEELLVRATELDPASSELAYRHARVLEDLLRSEDAMAEYCRTLSLGAEADAAGDTQARLDALYEVVRAEIPEGARESFVTGVSMADLALYEQAIQSFTLALDLAPDWSAAVYNRAVVLERMGRIAESLEDYRRYLQLTPSEVDPVVAAVSERIGMLEGLVALPTPSPSGALALGAVFPGMGQYYSGRGLGGTVVLAAAAAAVTTGILFKEITVRCLTSASPGGSCPPDQIVDESTSRPYLVPALGAAAAVTVIGAIEAFVKARGRRAEVAGALAPQVEARGPRISGPSVTVRRGRVDLALVALRFN